MVIGGQHFSQYTIDRIQQTLDDEPSISQLELSRRVCQWLEWRSPNGRLQDMSCRKALARLDQLDLVKLPRPNRSYSFEKPATQTIEPVVANARCTLDQLGQISVEPVISRYCSDSKVWFALLDRYHYLGSGPLCGAQIRYRGRTPLGVLDAQCWARDPDDPQKSKRRYELPIEQKESYKWLRSLQKVAQVQALCPDTLLVSIGDRESDIYELFEAAQHTPHAPGLLVRSEKSRNRKIDQGFLRDVMAHKDVAGSLQIHVPRSGSRKARDTWVDIRFAKVSLKRPKRNSTLMPAIDIWAVYVLERPGQASVKSPIEWMLLTTVAVNSFANAQQRVQWYSGRWGIEVYHRTLKSGCRIKDRQLGTADRLETCLGVDMVVAWRIYHLTMLGREVPDAACTVFFKDVEWKALCCYGNKTPVPPETPPTLKEAIYIIASMGGHLGRKSDGFPGPQTLWRGLQRLDTATEMFVIFSHQNPNSMQSGP